MRAILTFAQSLAAVLSLCCAGPVLAQTVHHSSTTQAHAPAAKPGAKPAAKPKQIGVFEDWAAATHQEGGQTACYISDLIPTAQHLDVAWCMAYDLFPTETMEQKKRFYAEAVAEKWLTVFTHDQFTPWGYIEQGAGAAKFDLRKSPEIEAAEKAA